MLIKINKSEDLSRYNIEVKINNYILKAHELPSYIIMDKKLEIESFLSLNTIDSKNDNFIQKIGEFCFWILYINFNSVDDLLDSREYKNNIFFDVLNNDGILEINYFWDIEEKKVDVKIETTDGNIISNKIIEINNQAIYADNKKTYKRVRKCSWIILFTIPSIILIIACICKHIEMIIGQIVILIILILFALITYLIKKKKGL